MMRTIARAAAVALLMACGATATVPAVASAAGPVPYQYIAKVYTEALGRAPDQGGWAASVRQFQTVDCNATQLALFGKNVLTSSEFNALGYDNTSKMIVAFRTILNRDGDPTYAAGQLDSRAVTWPDMIDSMFASPEFSTLAGRICSTTTPDYNFGTVPAVDVATSGSGFTGTQAALQRVLDATPRGGVVTLAQRAVVRMSSTLTIPAGVTLRTTGSPTPDHYANMARLVRANSWPTFAAAVVTLRPGAKLDHVWIDGQMGDPTGRHNGAASNVRVLSGTGTAVNDNRIGNTPGATNVSSAGGGDVVDACVDNEFNRNLVEAYSSDHGNGNWADGLSIGCEDAEVTDNDIVDASDVGLIVFGQNGFTQVSQLRDNVVVNAGQGAFASLGVDPWNNYPAGRGDGPGVASRNFTGSDMSNNYFWNSPRSTNAIGIAIGTRPWTGDYNWNGRGMRVTGNTKGTLDLYARTGIVVSGMLNATVTGNSLPTALVDDTSACARANVGAAVTAGYASGTIQGPYLDTDYTACIG